MVVALAAGDSESVADSQVEGVREISGYEGDLLHSISPYSLGELNISR